VIEPKEEEYSISQTITRAEFAAWLVKSKNLPLSKLFKDPTGDVKMSSWAAPYVNAVIKYGLITPSADGKFYPDEGIKRSEAEQILKRLDEFNK
jgi:hypothetical protein